MVPGSSARPGFSMATVIVVTFLLASIGNAQDHTSQDLTALSIDQLSKVTVYSASKRSQNANLILQPNFEPNNSGDGSRHWPFGVQKLSRRDREGS